MSKRIALELSIGHTHGTEKTYYSGRQVEELLADSGLPFAIIYGKGTEGSPHPLEEISFIKINWDETTNGKVEVFCKLLSDFLGKVADKMHQRWVFLQGHAYSANCMYPINISLNLEGFGEFGNNPTERRSIHQDTFYSPQLVFRGTHTESYDLGESSYDLGESQADRSPLENQLKNYYGEKRCIIDGCLDNSNIDWVPFDGDITHSDFKNLVPVGRRHLLQAINPGVRSKLSKAQFRFSKYLTAERLLYKPKQYFHDGMPALAFGCARLGEALALEFANDFDAQEDDGWAFLSQCLFYLPYRMNSDLLKTTLERVMLWLEKRPPCPYARRSALLLAIANLYQDVGDWDRAENLYNRILRSPGLTLKTEAATLRRRMIGRYFRAPSERLLVSDIPHIKGLNEDIDFRASLAIAEGWWHIVRERPQKCLKILERFNPDKGDGMGNYSPHNIFELKLTRAAAYKARGEKPTLILDEVKRYAHTLSHTRLRPIVTEHIAPVVFGPELGGAIEPLRSEFVVTPSMFKLSPMFKLLDRVAKALLEARCAKITGRPIWVD